MEKEIKKIAGGKGTGLYRRGNVLTNINDLEVGQLIIVDSKTYRATNLAKVTQTFSDKFYAVFANPESPAEKRQSSDEEFVVHPHDLDKGEYFIALEPAPGSEHQDSGMSQQPAEGEGKEAKPEVGQKAKAPMPSKDEALADAEGAEAKPEPKGRDEAKEASKKVVAAQDLVFGVAVLTNVSPKEIKEVLSPFGKVMNISTESEARKEGAVECGVSMPQDKDNILAFAKAVDGIDGAWIGSIGGGTWGTFAENHDDLTAVDFVTTSLSLDKKEASKKVAVHPAGEAIQEGESKYALELAEMLFISGFADEIERAEDEESLSADLKGVGKKLGYNESGKDLTEYVPELMAEHGLEMPTADLKQLGQELVNNINAKWKGKLTVDELLDKYPHVAIDLALGSQGHGVSPEDDPEVAVFIEDKGVSSHQLYQEGIGDRIRDEAYSVLSDFIGRKEASKKVITESVKKASKKIAERGVSDSAEDLFRMLQSVVVLSLKGDDQIELTDEKNVVVGIMYDLSGYNPGAAIVISQDTFSEDECLQEAFADLEAYEWDKKTPEEQEELDNEAKELDMSDGHELLTEGWDGKAFRVSGKDLQKAIVGEGGENFESPFWTMHKPMEVDKIKFVEPEKEEVKEPEEPETTASKKVAAPEVPAKPEPQTLAAWDDSDILSGIVENIKEDPDRMAELKEDGVNVDDDVALFDVAVEDQDLLSMYWDDFVDNVNSVLKERMSSSGVWDISGRNMGWQSRSGEKRAKIETYEDLRDKVLPNTSELTITMTAGEGDSIDMRVSHHDAPMGEFYTLTPIEPLVTGDKVKLTSVAKTYDNEWIGKEVTIVSFDGLDQYDEGVMTYTVEDEEGNQLDVTDSDFEAVAKTASKKVNAIKEYYVAHEDSGQEVGLVKAESQEEADALVKGKWGEGYVAWMPHSIGEEAQKEEKEMMDKIYSSAAKTVKAFGEEPASALEAPDNNPITKNDPDETNSFGHYSQTTPEAEPEKEEQFIAEITLNNGKVEKIPFDADVTDIDQDVADYLESKDIDWKSWKWEDMTEVHNRPDQYEFESVKGESNEDFYEDGPSDDDIVIDEDGRIAYSAGKEIASISQKEYYNYGIDALAEPIMEWMEAKKFWPNVWQQQERGDVSQLVIKKKGSVDGLEETASRDIPDQMPFGSHGTYMSELLAGIETIREAGNTGEVSDDGLNNEPPAESNFTGVNEKEKFDRTEASLVVEELLAAKAVSAVDFDGFMEVMADVYSISKEASKDFSEPFFNDDASAIIAAIKTNLN